MKHKPLGGSDAFHVRQARSALQVAATAAREAKTNAGCDNAIEHLGVADRNLGEAIAHLESVPAEQSRTVTLRSSVERLVADARDSVIRRCTRRRP